MLNITEKLAQRLAAEAAEMRRLAQEIREAARPLRMLGPIIAELRKELALTRAQRERYGSYYPTRR